MVQRAYRLLDRRLGVGGKYGYPRYVANQTYYSLIGREYEWELMPLAQEERVGTIVWSPLGWGRLGGKYRRGQPAPEVSRVPGTINSAPPVPDERLFTVVDALDAIARETGKTVPQIALNWVLQRPTVSSVIVGARNEDQFRENLGAIGWSLTSAQIKQLDEASFVKPVYPYWHQRGTMGDRYLP